MLDRTQELRAQILDLAGRSAEKFAARPFIPGESSVPVSSKVFDASEMRMLVDSALDFWLTADRFAVPVFVDRIDAEIGKRR
jgi:CDP-6-deoxy-D-xylo-4-hexulose-3-dehydrase